jgi:hypothetical protein
MTKDHRPPGIDIVDILVTVCIIHIGAFCPFHENRYAAYAFKSADRGVYAAGNYLFGPPE